MTAFRGRPPRFPFFRAARPFAADRDRPPILPSAAAASLGFIDFILMTLRSLVSGKERRVISGSVVCAMALALAIWTLCVSALSAALVAAVPAIRPVDDLGVGSDDPERRHVSVCRECLSAGAFNLKPTAKRSRDKDTERRAAGPMPDHVSVGVLVANRQRGLNFLGDVFHALENKPKRFGLSSGGCS